MSQEESALSRKDKKALRDAERAQQKGKKRKHTEVAEPDALPQQDDENDAAPEQAIESTTSKSSKKRKAGELFSDTTADPTLASAPLNHTAEAAASSSSSSSSSTQPPKKKRQKTKKSTPPSTSDGTAVPPPKKSRFIVFVGNLPYKTTDSSLEKHFAKLQPFTLRHRTDPKTKKSKGFAFLEFEHYDRMKTCLKVFHHTLFDPEAIDCGDVLPDPTAPGKEDERGMHPDRRNGGGAAAGKGGKKGTKDTARRINVELTAGGGGGKSGERKERIREKNVRLNEQRERRAELEKKEKAKKERQEGGGKDKGGKEKKVELGGDIPAASATDGGIHPARLAMMGR